MTAPVPVPDGTTPPAEAVEAADDAAYLHQPSRREVSRGEYAWSCRCGALLGDASALVRHVAFETAAAVVAALDLPGRDRETAAKAWDEAASWCIGCDHVTAFRWCGICDQWRAVLRDRASVLRERRQS